MVRQFHIFLDSWFEVHTCTGKILPPQCVKHFLEDYILHN
jgi:hypothetical protein